MGTFNGDVLTNLVFRVWGRFDQFRDVLTRGRFTRGRFALHPVQQFNIYQTRLIQLIYYIDHTRWRTVKTYYNREHEKLRIS